MLYSKGESVIDASASYLGSDLVDVDSESDFGDVCATIQQAFVDGAHFARIALEAAALAPPENHRA